MKPTYWTLMDAAGNPVTNREGDTFKYSSQELARIGKRVVQKDREEHGYQIVEVD